MLPNALDSRKRHFRRDAGAAIENRGESLARDAQALRRLGHAQVERPKAVLPDDLAGVRGLCISNVSVLLSLVVIDQINIGRVFAIEAEQQPPIARDRDCPLALALASKRMELKAWGNCSWFSGPGGGGKRGQETAQAILSR